MGLLAEISDIRWPLAAAMLALYAAAKLRTYWRLRGFKGPFGAGFTNFWHTKALLSWKCHLWYDDMCSKYGPIVRLGPDDLLTCSADLLTYMSAVRSPYTRTKWYNRATRWDPNNDHIFSELDEEKHQRRRHQMALGYSGKENLSLESSMDVHIAELVDLIRSKYLSTDVQAKPFDFARKIEYLTLDVISHVGFGEPFGDLRADADVNELIATGETGLMFATIGSALGITWLLQTPLVAKTLGPSEKDPTGLGRMIFKARKIVEARFQRDNNTADGSDMLASFARHGLTPEELVTESVLQIIAGSDTTATSLRGIFLFLLSHPRVYAKLQAEVDKAAANGDFAGVIPDTEVRKLPYLQAVIKEGIRIHPPVTDAVPKRVPDGGDTVVVDGQSIFLPGGTNVSYAVWPLHRSNKIFGPDAHQFRPERWLVETDKTRLAEMNRTHELIFGYGKFQCLGKPIALMEIAKATFELLRNFDWCLANPERPWAEHNMMGIFTQRDMLVLASERR